jgi:predicted phage terminase large subunit-like protein
MLQMMKTSNSWLTRYKKLTEKGQRGLITLSNNWHKTARDQQLTPYGNWDIWLILAGRGWGKTRTGAEDIAFYALSNPESICAVVTPTFGDIRRVAFGGPSGLMSIIPKECLLSGRGQGYNSSSAEIRLYNGSKIMGFSATEPDRLRGPQFHRAWCDELAAWQYADTFDQLMFGLRLGKKPQCIITTTPKPTPLIKSLVKRNNIVITRGSTFDNAENLAQSALTMLKEKYANTRLGRQELYAEIVDEVEGALWKPSMIDEKRLTELPDKLKRIVIAVDPAVTNQEGSDETGIVVCGKGYDNRYYILDDLSARMSADAWANVVVNTFYKYEADRVIAEVNNGGDLVERLLRTVDSSVPYTAVRSSKGKLVRAEPISALYEQGKVSHVGTFSKLEDQMCSYTLDSRSSPDRLDALVWGLTELSKSSGQAIWRVT